MVDEVSKRDMEYRGTRYGDTHWLREIVTPCSEQPEKFDGIHGRENMNVHRNTRIQEAIQLCREGTDKSPGPCPYLIQCKRTGEGVRDFAPGVYGGEYMARSRYSWPVKGDKG